VNFAPRDFVVDAIAYLSGLEASEGKVYHITDPSPLSVDGMVALLGRATGARIVRAPLPYGLVRWAFGLGLIKRWTRIPPEAIDYFVHKSHYTSDHTQHDLRGSGITCPPFPAYAGALVAYMRAHPDVPAEAMI
jgi:uncharacterized protein YbjT (DUF2867 family)